MTEILSTGTFETLLEIVKTTFSALTHVLAQLSISRGYFRTKFSPDV